jgi:hypothetical protein
MLPTTLLLSRAYSSERLCQSLCSSATQALSQNISGLAVKMNIPLTVPYPNRDLQRNLTEILELPRTPLAAHVCRKLKTSLEVKQAERKFDLARARLQANHQHIIKVDKELKERFEVSMERAVWKTFTAKTDRVSA